MHGRPAWAFSSTSTQIPGGLWFRTRSRPGRGEFLFIEARRLRGSWEDLPGFCKSAGLAEVWALRRRAAAAGGLKMLGLLPREEGR